MPSKGQRHISSGAPATLWSCFTSEHSFTSHSPKLKHQTQGGKQTAGQFFPYSLGLGNGWATSAEKFTLKKSLFKFCWGKWLSYKKLMLLKHSRSSWNWGYIVIISRQPQQQAMLTALPATSHLLNLFSLFSFKQTEINQRVFGNFHHYMTVKLTKQQCMLWRTWKSNINLGKLIQVESPDRRELPNSKPIQSKLFITLSPQQSNKPHFYHWGIVSEHHLFMTSCVPSSYWHTDLHFICHLLCSWQLSALSLPLNYPFLSIFSRATERHPPGPLLWTSSYTGNKATPWFSL